MKNVNHFFAIIILFFFLGNANAQWQSCGTYTGNVLSFAVMDSVLIAGTYGGGAYYTCDGINWTYSTAGMTDLKIISMTKSGNSIYAGSEAGGVYRSTDNGINWTPVNTGLTSFEIHTICSNSGNIYAGTNTGVFKSSDNGANWTKISTSAVGSTIFVVTAYENKVIATSANGIFITTNGGANWSGITSGTGGYIYCLTNSNNTVYAGSSSSGVYKTTNDGLNWIQINSGLPSGKAVRAVFCESDKIYAAVYNSGGIYFLPATGSTWIAANQGLTQLTCYTVTVFKNYVYAGTTSGIFRRSKSEFSSIQKANEKAPNEFKLYNNYPNPFNSQTVMKFSVSGKNRQERVKLELYNISGKLVECLLNENLYAGVYEFKYNASNLSSGCYFIKLTSSAGSRIGKIILIK